MISHRYLSILRSVCAQLTESDGALQELAVSEHLLDDDGLHGLDLGAGWHGTRTGDFALNGQNQVAG